MPPVVRESHLGLPLDEVVIVAARVLETHLHVDKIDRDTPTPDAEGVNVLRIGEVNSRVRRKPWSGEDVLTARVNERDDATTEVGPPQSNTHDRAKYLSEARNVELERIPPRKRRRCPHRLAETDDLRLVLSRSTKDVDASEPLLPYVRGELVWSRSSSEDLSSAPIHGHPQPRALREGLLKPQVPIACRHHTTVSPSASQPQDPSHPSNHVHIVGNFLPWSGGW